MASVSVRTLIHESLTDLNVLGQGETLTSDLAATALARLNDLFDNWNAQREAVWVEEFKTFTFVPNQQDYTIGPTAADFTVDHARPNRIDGANAILNNVSPDVRNAINVRDWQWWLNLNVRAVTTTYPTDVYYAPDWPNGTLHFWPKPTAAYGLELVMSNTLGQVTLNDTVNMPSGYASAIRLTLNEDCASAYGRNLPPILIKKAMEARARIFANNDITPRLRTQDAGMPSNSRNRCTYNYRTGTDINANR